MGDDAPADFVNGDVASISAVSMGSYSHDTQIGGNTTVPLVWIAKTNKASGRRERRHGATPQRAA